MWKWYCENKIIVGTYVSKNRVSLSTIERSKGGAMRGIKREGVEWEGLSKQTSEFYLKGAAS